MDPTTEEKICLSCEQKQLFQRGILPETVEKAIKDGQVDEIAFFNRSELESEGWEEDKNHFVSSHDAAKKLGKAAKECMDEGYMVIWSFSSMAICGDEAFVELWKKERSSQMLFYREANGDYMICDPKNKVSNNCYSGVATAIIGLPTALCWTSISKEFLSTCTQVKRDDVPPAWREILYARADWWNTGNRELPYPFCLTCGEAITDGIYCQKCREKRKKLCF
jgi:hypothetical protein